jgi:hypothetical protein
MCFNFVKSCKFYLQIAEEFDTIRNKKLQLKQPQIYIFPPENFCFCSIKRDIYIYEMKRTKNVLVHSVY